MFALFPPGDDHYPVAPVDPALTAVVGRRDVDIDALGIQGESRRRHVVFQHSCWPIPPIGLAMACGPETSPIFRAVRSGLVDVSLL